MTRNPTTTLDQEISVLKRYKELFVQAIKLPQDEPSLMAFLKKFLKNVCSLGRPPLTAQAQKEATQIFAKHLHALDPNGYSTQELMEALEEVNALAPRVQAIYESYRTELGLRDYPRLLESGLKPAHLSVLANVPCLTPIWAISDLIHRLEGLKHKRERETKIPAPPPEQGGGKAVKKTLSVADIITDRRVSIGKSWFTELKKRIPLPPSDTIKDHGEAWTDGEKVIEMIKEWRTAHPKRPPPKLATTIQKKHTSRRKK